MTFYMLDLKLQKSKWITVPFCTMKKKLILKWEQGGGQNNRC